MTRWTVETVAFPLDDGGQVLVRVDEMYGGMATRGGKVEAAITQAGQTFESTLGTIKDVADAVQHQLARLAIPPAEVTVEFGLEISTKAAAVVASASATAQLSIALVWKPTHAGGSSQ